MMHPSSRHGVAFSSLASTRFYSTIQTISSRVNAFRFSFFVSAPFVWNSLPSDVCCSHTYNLFRCKLKQCHSPLVPP